MNETPENRAEASQVITFIWLRVGCVGALSAIPVGALSPNLWICLLGVLMVLLAGSLWAMSDLVAKGVR